MAIFSIIPLYSERGILFQTVVFCVVTVMRSNQALRKISARVFAHLRFVRVLICFQRCLQVVALQRTIQFRSSSSPFREQGHYNAVGDQRFRGRRPQLVSGEFSGHTSLSLLRPA